MTETLLFITGVLTEIIVRLLLARHTRVSAAPSGSNERILVKRPSKADIWLKQFSRQLKAQAELIIFNDNQLPPASKYNGQPSIYSRVSDSLGRETIPSFLRTGSNAESAA